MKLRIERILLVVALVIGLSCAWTDYLDKTATVLVGDGFSRALVTFATARTVNAALSVAQTANVGFITFGQVLHPIDELVGQFSELMLAACVALGAMKILIIIGGYKGLTLLLTITALWWVWVRWQEKPIPAPLSTAFLVLLLIRFAVPLVSVGSELIFQGFMEAGYTTAQKALADIPTSELLGTSEVASEADSGIRGAIENIKGRWSDVKTIHTHIERLKQFAARGVAHIINLVVVFLLQTLIVPLFLFWVLYRMGVAMVEPKRRTR